MKNPNTKRTELIAVRVTPKERKIIEANAAKNDLSLSNYIRATGLYTKEIKIDAKQTDSSVFDLENYFT